MWIVNFWCWYSVFLSVFRYHLNVVIKLCSKCLINRFKNIYNIYLHNFCLYYIYVTIGVLCVCLRGLLVFLLLFLFLDYLQSLYANVRKNHSSTSKCDEWRKIRFCAKCHCSENTPNFHMPLWRFALMVCSVFFLSSHFILFYFKFYISNVICVGFILLYFMKNKKLVFKSPATILT